MLDHFRIQAALVSAIGVTVLGYHFIQRVLPALLGTWGSFEPVRALPYVATALALVGVDRVRHHTRSKHEELMRLSPGKGTPNTEK